ncbi:hypothetical protein MXB_2362 [Myxobolus squamalis]|nr:hypothetical protein MXB_2362 [Myxobolus squamalis]
MIVTNQAWNSRVLNVSVALSLSTKLTTYISNQSNSIFEIQNDRLVHNKLRPSIPDLWRRCEKELVLSGVGDLKLSDSSTSVQIIPANKNHCLLIPSVNIINRALKKQNQSNPEISRDSLKPSDRESEASIDALNKSNSSKSGSKNNSKHRGLNKIEESMLIRLSLSEIELAAMTPADFNGKLGNLSRKEIFILKDIRRRSKNKIAARECRKRRISAHETLLQSVKELEEQCADLNLKFEKLKSEKKYILEKLKIP